MTLRQKLLKWIYPLWMVYARLRKKHRFAARNKPGWEGAESVYDIPLTSLDGKALSMSDFQGKKILIVNTASHCVYTNQYDALQQLYEENRDKLEIIAFPSNDFKNQERDNEQEIAAFCSTYYGVKFPIMAKSVVRKRPDQHPVFQWLTNAHKNGWNDVPPLWNFSKYLINENGVLTHVFGPSVSPTSKKVKVAIQGRG